MNDDLCRRIWEWLPARATRSRVTLAGTIAAALDVPVVEVSRALVEMERAGHAIRDRATGPLSMSWHRGTPPPSPSRQHAAEPGVEEWTLC